MNIIANKNRQWAMKIFEKTAWKCHMCKKKNRIPYFMPFDYFASVWKQYGTMYMYIGITTNYLKQSTKQMLFYNVAY